MKKYLSIILAVFVAASALTGCAGQTNKRGFSTNTSAAYAKLIAYKTEGYEQQSLADFNAALAQTPDELTTFLAAIADVNSSITPADENYDFFTTTLSFSSAELYREHMGEEFSFFITISKENRLCDYLDEEGNPVYEFTCIVESNVPYSINDSKLVTVAERDKTFLTFKEEMQNYLNNLSEAEIAGGSIKTMLIDKSAELAKSLSTENMKLSPCEISLIEIIGEEEISNTNTPAGAPKKEDMPDDSFSKEDYQKLLALQFDDYRHMKISEFQNKVWEMTDTPEYTELLERFFKSEKLYQMKDSDETAAFLFYVLEPLTAEKWQTHTYSGAATSDFPALEDNATLEYTYTLTILAADKVMVKDYCDMRLGVKDMMQNILRNRTKEELQNGTLMLTELKTYVDEMLSYIQTPEVSVAIEYAYFPLSTENDNNAGAYFDDNVEQRRYPNGTEEDYLTLFSLKTPEYENLPLADFNASLLEWTNENPEGMGRISEDTVWNDFQVSLTDEELSFVKLTVFLSGMENGKAIQSSYAGEPINPYYEEELPQKIASENRAATWCSLYYQFSYSISDAKKITVGERDRQIESMIDAIHAFWDNTDIEKLLKMSESDIVQEFEKIAAKYSTNNVIITIDNEQVQFEYADSPPDRDSGR